MTQEQFIKNLPPYAGGRPQEHLYIAGHGVKDASFPAETEALMQIIRESNPEEFTAYIKRLASDGYEEVFSNECDGNIYRMYRADEGYVYTYYTAYSGEVRIITDCHSECTPQEFGYEYKKQPGERTILYQYGLPMNEAGLNIIHNDEQKIDCGMMYLMKLADNSIFLIDGAAVQQFDEAGADAFMAFLKDITGTCDGEKVRISGWYMSHGHNDHFAGFCRFLAKYADSVDIERIFFNFSSANSENEKIKGVNWSYIKLIETINKYLNPENIKYLKIHTGEEIKLADAKIKVLYTHEDLVDPETGLTAIGWDYNNTSSVLMIEFDGKKFLLTGDINKPANRTLMKLNRPQSLRCDIIQMAHHVINDLSALYRETKSKVLLIPQSPKGCFGSEARRASMGAAITYLRDGMIFYASKETVGIELVGDKLKKTFSAPVYAGKYAGWGWEW